VSISIYDQSRIAHTKDRGSLTHDDRVDAVAGAFAHFHRAMMMDVDQAAKAMRDEEMQAEIEDFLEGFNQPTYRGMRVNGVRLGTRSSSDGWSGDSRPEAEFWRPQHVERERRALTSTMRSGQLFGRISFCNPSLAVAIS
jgi:hypothetical protein